MTSQILSRSVAAVRDRSTALYLNYLGHHPAKINEEWSLSPSESRAVRLLWPKNYEWPPAARWMSSLLTCFRDLVRVELVDDIPQPYQGTVVFGFQAYGQRHDVAICYTDYPAMDENCSRNCELCFKMQYRPEGYGYDNVIPGGYVVDTTRLYMYLSQLRQQRDRSDFKFDVYGRFGRGFGTAIRERAIGLLNRQQEFAFEGGLELLPYQEFVKETAQAKVCVDLPGRGDFCFRLINYLAIGSCVVAYPHKNLLHVPLIGGKHIVYTKADSSDLVELCEYYLRHAREREEIARNARDFFDLYLHKDNLARYYLRTCLDRFTQANSIRGHAVSA